MKFIEEHQPVPTHLEVVCTDEDFANVHEASQWKQIFDTLIFLIKTEQPLVKKIDEIKEAVSDLVQQKIVYARIKGTEGHVIANKRCCDDNLIDRLLQNGISIDNIQVDFL